MGISCKKVTGKTKKIFVKMENQLAKNKAANVVHKNRKKENVES